MINWADLMLRGAGGVVSALRSLLPYGSIIALGAMTVISARSCNERRSLESALSRATEAAKLAEAQIPIVKAATRKELEGIIRAEQEQSDVLRSALRDAEKRVKDATGKAPKVVEVIRWRTIPGAALGLVNPGDELGIRGTSVKMETREGNHVITGTAAVWRLKPAPLTLIYEGPIDLGSVKAEEVKREEVPREKRWGFGPVGTIDTSGSWAAGPQVGYRVGSLDLSLGMTFPDQRTIGAVMLRW